MKMSSPKQTFEEVRQKVVADIERSMEDCVGPFPGPRDRTEETIRGHIEDRGFSVQEMHWSKDGTALYIAMAPKIFEITIRIDLVEIKPAENLSEEPLKLEDDQARIDEHDQRERS